MLFFAHLIFSISNVVSAIESKRGLIGVNTANIVRDQATLLSSNALSWAYNYEPAPPNATWFGNLTDSFVPQLWGSAGTATFANTVKNSKLGNKQKYVLAFNEPDGHEGGQANMLPATAASIWKQSIQPLKAQGYTLGAPAITGAPTGKVWLRQFMGNCTDCTIDFIPIHWYGNFEGLASHLGEVYTTFNNTPIWITELALASASMSDTIAMMNQTLPWLDALSWVQRYAWFGGFRASESNIGPNATFLDNQGQLTELGRMYLGSQAKAVPSVATTGATDSAKKSGTLRLEAKEFVFALLWCSLVSVSLL